MGWGGNTLKNLYIHKALSLIGAELELLNLKTTHPEQFNSPVSTAVSYTHLLAPEISKQSI